MKKPAAAARNMKRKADADKHDDETDDDSLEKMLSKKRPCAVSSDTTIGEKTREGLYIVESYHTEFPKPMLDIREADGLEKLVFLDCNFVGFHLMTGTPATPRPLHLARSLRVFRGVAGVLVITFKSTIAQSRTNFYREPL